MEALVNVWTRKSVALERRRQQTNRLIKRADEAYESNNPELYEAYEECIQYQQNKMLELVKEVIELRMILQDIEEDEEDKNDDFDRFFGQRD